MRIELTRAGLLVYLANHYTTRGALGWLVGWWHSNHSNLFKSGLFTCLDDLFTKLKLNNSKFTIKKINKNSCLHSNDQSSISIDSG